MRTKWEILKARQEKAQADADRILAQLMGLEGTDCNLHCSGCGELFYTEADFAKHFVIPDERYLNLGDCPNSKAYETKDQNEQDHMRDEWPNR